MLRFSDRMSVAISAHRSQMDTATRHFGEMDLNIRPWIVECCACGHSVGAQTAAELERFIKPIWHIGYAGWREYGSGRKICPVCHDALRSGKEIPVTKRPAGGYLPEAIYSVPYQQRGDL